MAGDYVQAKGTPVQIDSLVVDRAKDFASLVEFESTPSVSLVGCLRQDEGVETIVIEVLPTVPQRPVHDVRRCETVAVTFRQNDDRYPDVRALRGDFPRERMLHLNPGVAAAEQPSLCLFSESWPDARLTLTANELLFRIQDWFNGTANGQLHRDDQPLEPAFFSDPQYLVLDPGVIGELTEGASFQVELDLVVSDAGKVLIPRRSDRLVKANLANGYVMTLVSDLHDHSLMNIAPSSFHDLDQMVAPVGIDLIGKVQEGLLALGAKRKTFRFLVLFLLLRRQRGEGIPFEVEPAAFICLARGENANLDDVLLDLGLDGSAYDDSRTGKNLEICHMTVRFELTPETARKYSGASDLNPKMFAVGAGAIGSQVIANGVRSGFTSWFVVDRDYLLPHNLVRHELAGYWVGHAKVSALAADLNSIFTQQVVDGEVVDVLKDLSEKTAAAMNEAEAIVDLSASPAVSRFLAVDSAVKAPRCSIFANPTGRDMVFLGEDPERTYRLDCIEAQYYRAIADLPELQGHLQGANVFGGCRDVTSVVSQELMGLHGVQGSRALRLWLESKKAMAVVVKTTPAGLDATTVQIDLGKPIYVGQLDSWHVYTDAILLEELRRQRKQRLPNETGGVLLAHFDAQRRTIYVCHQIPAPADSLTQPTVYIRGSDGLSQEYKRIRSATANGLAYFGEWHSHPDGAACRPSKDDLLAGVWLAEESLLTSLPGLMLIVGDLGQTCWILCRRNLESGEPIHLTMNWNGTTP